MSANTPKQQTVTNFGQHALASVQEMRERARQHIESGAVTEDHKADRSQVIGILNEVLATELVCMLRYKSHYYRACGIN
jgi:bacterioferritin